MLIYIELNRRGERERSTKSKKNVQVKRDRMEQWPQHQQNRDTIVLTHKASQWACNKL